MYNTNERDKMAKEYDHTDHMVVMSELLVLYKLKNETEQKILIATKELDRMKEYKHSDHMSVMTELLVLYKLKNETEQKIDVANKENERMKALLKKKEDNDDEIPF